MKKFNIQKGRIRRFTPKRSFIITCYLLFFTVVAFGQDIPYNFTVSSYDLCYELNVDEGIFKSVQNILIKNASPDTLYQINFLLHPDLGIDDIEIQNSRKKKVPIKHWKKTGMTKLYNNELQIVEIDTKTEILPGEQYLFHLEYQMQPGAFSDSSQFSGNPLDLVISPRVSHAIGPTTGHNAIFNRNILAPFLLKIKYPEGNQCCVPGDFISSEKTGRSMIETYHSRIPNIPTFSCSSYEKRVRKAGDLTFEFYLYPGQSFADKMIAVPARYVQLYTSTFGDIGTGIYRFGNIGGYDSKSLFLENKGNAIYLTDLLTRYYTAEEGVKDMFNGLIAHELIHNWNIFSVNWAGELTDWFEEGGANFIASWAGEQVISEEFSVYGRMHFISAFSGETGSRGYESKETLESVSKNSAGDQEVLLIYYYGALVWEQLRQKLGDEDFFAGLSDFFGKYRSKTATYHDFLQCLQNHTHVNVEAYLDQWIKHNAVIDLSISNVNTRKNGDLYDTEIEFMVDSDRDYELIMSVGYKTLPEDEMKLIDAHTLKKGIHKVTFQSKEEPVFIQIDPTCLVPQINLDNNVWSQRINEE